MKKLLLIAAIAVMNSSLSIFADDDSDKNYLRNSVYMLKLNVNGNEENADAYATMMARTFDTINFARNYERYNDFSLKNRHIEFENTPKATPEEISAIGKESIIEKYINEQLVAEGLKKNNVSEYEYAARLLKYFEQEHTANKLIAKLYNKPDTDEDKIDWDNDLYTLYDLGLKGMSQEAKDNAKATDNLMNQAKGAADKLLTNTYVCVNRYSYVSAEEVIVSATAAAKIAMQKLPAIAQAAAQKGIDAIASKIKGYFVRVNAYLFQLDWNDDLKNKLYSQYWENPDGFLTDDSYKLKYVGKSSKNAPAALSLKATNEDALVARATVRGTDAAFAALQRDHENFRPMTSLHVIDGKLAAYIGMKEGIKSGDKFDVFEAVADPNDPNLTEWKSIGTIKVSKKDGVWDNRIGAGVQLEGESASEDEETAGTAKYTIFDGKPSKKIGEGCMIRLSK